MSVGLHTHGAKRKRSPKKAVPVVRTVAPVAVILPEPPTGAFDHVTRRQCNAIARRCANVVEGLAWKRAAEEAGPIPASVLAGVDPLQRRSLASRASRLARCLYEPWRCSAAEMPRRITPGGETREVMPNVSGVPLLVADADGGSNFFERRIVFLSGEPFATARFETRRDGTAWSTGRRGGRTVHAATAALNVPGISTTLLIEVLLSMALRVLDARAPDLTEKLLRFSVAKLATDAAKLIDVAKVVNS